MDFLEAFLPDLTQKMFLICDMKDVSGMTKLVLLLLAIVSLNYYYYYYYCCSDSL